MAPTGLAMTNTCFDSGPGSTRLKSRVLYALIAGSTVYDSTNSFTYTNDLALTHTDPRGLTVTRVCRLCSPGYFSFRFTATTRTPRGGNLNVIL